MKRFKLFFLLIILVFLTTTGFGCKGQSSEIRQAMQPVTLEYWRVWDDSDSFSEIISAYNKIHPNININYKKLRYEEFEAKLLDALSEDKGPDIFSIDQAWLLRYQNKVQPLPSAITLPYQTIKGSIKKETVIELKTVPTLSLRELKNNFVDEVYNNVVIAETQDQKTVNNIYGLPLSLDTLVLYYNRDLLNSASIPQPPITWSEFQSQVKRLIKQDKQGNIVQAGVAMGTGKNIERSFDLLSLLMMQNGAVMLNNGTAVFHQIPSNLEGRSSSPAVDALVFYTDFANPAKEVYTWNKAMPNSLEAFISGKTAFFFGYSYHLSAIKARAPKLNFSISKIPQIGGNQEINYANYWLEVVSKKTKYPNESWDFLQFASKAENVIKYLEKSKRPTAIRSLVSKQMEDLDLYVFAGQTLTAKSWYKGKGSLSAEKAFEVMAEAVVDGVQTPVEAVNLAVNKVNQSLP